ncbi:hypothetical protein EON65_59205 [archaeon]|nr:MAG: hypothetical protein EON65_59205 [archaeon]
MPRCWLAAYIFGITHSADIVPQNIPDDCISSYRVCKPSPLFHYIDNHDDEITLTINSTNDRLTLSFVDDEGEKRISIQIPHGEYLSREELSSAIRYETCPFSKDMLLMYVTRPDGNSYFWLEHVYTGQQFDVT